MDLIVRMIFGAHLYGTADERSDIDYRGVFLPSREEIAQGCIPRCRRSTTGDDRSKNTARDVDEDIYALPYFIQMACRGEIVAMDMLHAPPDAWTEATDIWQEMVRHRQRFYSRRLKTFQTYVQRQTAKYGIKGSRLHAAATILAFLKEQNPRHRLRQVWDDLPRLAFGHECEPDPGGMRQYQVCGKYFQESAAIGHVIPILEKYLETYGKRAKSAIQNREIDWKAVSHALRAAIQTRELLTAGTIQYPLRDAPYLKMVKEGRLDYPTEVAPALERLMDEVGHRIECSSLPDQPDLQFWHDFLGAVLEKHRLGAGPVRF